MKIYWLICYTYSNFIIFRIKVLDQESDIIGFALVILGLVDVSG